MLSPIWTFTASVGAPRIAAVDFPNGLGFGIPGDAEGQRAVLEAALHALEQIQAPGGVVHLPFEWKPVKGVRLKPSPMPPIAALCIKKPWLLKKLIYGPVPEK